MCSSRILDVLQPEGLGGWLSQTGSSEELHHQNAQVGQVNAIRRVGFFYPRLNLRAFQWVGFIVSNFVKEF